LFKQTNYWVIDSVKRSIVVFWFMSATRHRACSVHVFVADSLRMSFKQTNYRVTSSMTRSIVICFCSRLTIERVIEANSLSSDELDNKINIERVFEADSLSIHIYYTHVTELVLIASIAFNKACSVHVYRVQ